MPNPTVYVETTVIGHLTGRLQSDILVAARQIASQNLWDIKDQFSIFVSQIVVDECAAGDPIAAAERLRLLDGIARIDVTQDADSLANALIKAHAVPSTQPRDAAHIALAATNGLQYLVTWNFRHIANISVRARIETTCRELGFEPPLICTPEELLGAKLC